MPQQLRLFASLNVALLILLFLGTAVIQVLIGGMRPVFAIPGYALIALAGLCSLAVIHKRRPLPSAACLISTLIFAGYLVGRSYASPVEYLARPDRWLVLACLGVYLVLALYATDPKLRLALLGGLLALAVGHVVVGAIQFTQGNNYLPFDYFRADYGRRASGFYVCPNHFAGLLEMLAVSAAALFFWSRTGIKSRMLLIYFVPLALLGIGISGSRGGYLSTACAFLALLLMSLAVVRKTLPHRLLAITCGSLIILLAVGAASVSLMKKDILLSSRVGNVLETNNMRLQLWEAAMRQYHQQPAIGTGSGTYFYLGRLYRDARVDYDPVWVHNDYLHLLAEYGVAGAVTFLFFLGTHLWQGWRACRTIVRKRLLEANMLTSNTLALVLASLAAVAAMIAHSVVDFNLHITGNALVMAMFFGFLANPPIERPRSEGPVDWKWWPFRLLLPAAAVLLLVEAVPHLRGEWYAEKARVALRDGRYLEAIRNAQFGLDQEKTNPNLYYYLGEARRLLGNSMTNEIARKKMNEAAIGAFDQSLKLFPQDEKLWVRKSQAFDMIGRHDEALQNLDKARELDPLLPALNTYYGAHYQLLGNNELALQYYEKTKGHEAAKAGREEILKQIKDAVGR